MLKGLTLLHSWLPVQPRHLPVSTLVFRGVAGLLAGFMPAQLCLCSARCPRARTAAHSTQTALIQRCTLACCRCSQRGGKCLSDASCCGGPDGAAYCQRNSPTDAYGTCQAVSRKGTWHAWLMAMMVLGSCLHSLDRLPASPWLALGPEAAMARAQTRCGLLHSLLSTAERAPGLQPWCSASPARGLAARGTTAAPI